MTRRTRLARVVAPIIASGMLLAGCSGSSGRAPADSVLACKSERAAFDAAAQNLGVVSAPVEAAALAVAKTPPGVKPTDDLGTKAEPLPAATDQVSDTYRALTSCRDARLALTTLAPKELAAESAAADDELAAARKALDLMRTCEATLPAAVDRLIADLPASRQRAARAANAIPPSQPFVALETATIHAKPDAGSARIADLRKGMRAQGAGGALVAGWTTVRLNDGSIGYVESAALEPVSPNPSAMGRVRPSETDASDPLVALAVEARRSFPRRVAMFTALIDAEADAVQRRHTAPPSGNATRG
ncbi:MAG TPA: hypothetical protein VKS60_15145 [Stellaceae bacterium]|nr:hypothetical protein [Stellaceae bacterium]